jgi:hypothetical protein
MIFKHRPSTEFPKATNITDNIIRKLFEDLGQMLFQTFRNIYDDIIRLEKVEAGSALPTAAQSYRGKMMLIPTTAGHDELYVCLATGTTPAYEWHKVTIS